MRIGQRQIGDGAPVYIIAELGVNHDGSPSRGMELVEAAARAGADAIKLQLFRADLLMSKAAKLAAYQRAAGEHDPLLMLRRLELSVERMSPMIRRAHALGMQAIVTVFSGELVEEALALPWDAFKSASPDVVNRPLLETMAATGRPLLVSTGAADMGEVERAAGWLEAWRESLALLQCVSSYPTRTEDASLGGMAALRSLRGLEGRIGYSDHTREVDTGELAADLGACILEKHLTYDRGAKGPDHGASLEPDEFRRYAELARDASVLRLRVGADAAARAGDPRIGPPEKRVLECERDVRLVSRQSITTRRAIWAGKVIERGDLTTRRPGTGMGAWLMGEVVGRRAARDLDEDEQIAEGDLA